MTQMLGLSFDCPASPSIELLNDPSARNGWGLAWYPAGDWAAAMVKDPNSTGRDPVTMALATWKTFRSTVFVGHVRGAAKRRTVQDTHPFVRSHAGRSWVLAHNGELDPERLATDLPLGTPPVFEPLGRTDSEHVFCWLLTRIRALGVRRLDAIGWPRLAELLAQVNALGQLNLILTDGLDLVAYRDVGGFGSLHWIRRIPPHRTGALATRTYTVDFEDAGDANRSMIVVSTTPLSDEPGWALLEPGEMLVARMSCVTARLAAAAVPTRAELLQADTREIRLPATARAAPPLEMATPGSAHGRPEAVLRPPRSSPRIVTVAHRTTYRYEKPVEHSTHLFRLRPVHDDAQRLLAHELVIAPDAARVAFDDVFGNHATRIDLATEFKELTIAARSTVELHATSMSAGPTDERHTIPLVWMPWQREMMQPYLLPPELPETQLVELSRYAMSFVARQDGDLVESVTDINRTIFKDYAYVKGATRLETTPFEVYRSRQGVCQDFANLFICLARLLNVPARYRVGYIYTGASHANPTMGDASHAWVELYLPWIGWRGFDPTNGCLAGLDHVRVACGRNYRDATPTSGTLYRGGGGEKLEIAVRFEDVGDDGRL